MDTNQKPATSCEAYPASGCSVRFILMGLNTFSVWIAIRPFFATEADARKEEAEYRKYFHKPANADHNGWKDFCVVKRTTTEEVCTQNPSLQGTGHLVDRTLQGVVGRPNDLTKNGQ